MISPRPCRPRRGGGQWSDDLPRLTNSSLVLIEFGDYEQARQQLTRALALMRRALEWRWEDIQRGLLADVDRCSGAYDRAAENYRAAIDLATTMGSRHKRTRHAIGLAAVARLSDRYDEAAAGSRAALDEAARLSDASQLARARLELALNLLMLGDAAQARRIATDALAVNVPLYHHRILLMNGLTAAHGGDAATAVGFFEQARDRSAALLAASPRFLAAAITRTLASCALSVAQAPSIAPAVDPSAVIGTIGGALEHANGVRKETEQLLRALAALAE